MKKLLTLALALVLSFQVSARPLEQDQLDQINAFIATLTQSSPAPFEVTATLSDVFLDDQTSLITAAKLNTVFAGIGTLNLGMQTLEGQLTLGVSGSLNPLVTGIDDEAVESLLAQLLEFVRMINEAGKYSAQVTMNMSPEGKTLTIKLTPAGPDAHPSFIQATLSAFVPVTLENGDIALDLVAQFSAEQTLIVTAQTALTNIVNDLAKGQMPSDQDLETLQTLFQELIGTILF